jgi:hypothetical protein
MSERSFRRENQRRIATERRRESLRARKAAAAAVAVGAFALAAPAASNAANFVVNDNGTNSGVCVPNSTPAGCTLPDAVDQANANSEADTITFDSSLSGSTIDLTSGTNTGSLDVDSPYPLTITGLGANNLTVTAGGGSYVFDVTNPGSFFSPPYAPTDLTVSGLKITGGQGTYAGGISTDFNTNFTLTQSVVTGNSASGDFNSEGPYAIFGAAGGGLTNRGISTISNTYFYDNQSTGDGPYMGGGAIDNAGQLTLNDSLITGNYSHEIGGGIFNGGTKYPTKLNVNNTTIAGNTGHYGGGGVAAWDIRGSKYGASDNRINSSTISGNNSDDGDGGGAYLKYTAGKDRWTISHSTISGPNQTASSDGGGIALDAVAGTFTLIDSTVSGNTAYDTGGGVYVGSGAEKYPQAVQIQNSTIASNQTLSSDSGGGIYLSDFYGSEAPNGHKYPAHTTVGSTIVADNTVDGQPEDVDQGTEGEGGVGLDLSFSLIENPTGNVDITELPPGSNIFGVDPQLGALANNGGPTYTQLPATTSAVIDKGNAPSGLTTDQRGEARTVDTDPANANDGTDIGSVELPSGTGPPTPPPAGGDLGTKVHNVKKKRKKRSHIIRTFHKSAKVHLTFSSPIAGATFTCSVDGAAFEPCTSPLTVRLNSAPGHGASHSIKIVTKDQNGNQLGQPKIFKFRIIQK